jgi:hypothetical protein
MFKYFFHVEILCGSMRHILPHFKINSAIFTHAMGNNVALENIKNYFAIRGGSRKNIAKKIIPSVPTSKNV